MKNISKLILVTSIILFSSIYSFSEPVNSKKALTVAENFYSTQYYRAYGSYPKYHAVTINPINYKNTPSYWVCTFSKAGFVIVAANDNAFPIIGYSFDSEFDLNNVPESVQAWLNKVSASNENPINNANNYKNVWNKYLDKQEILKMQNKSLQSVPYFVTTRWNQGINYNNDCPVNSAGPGGHCVTGCVATAMAQAMKYYNYPEHGKDSMLYTGDVNIKFEDTYYRWDSMTNSANNISADAISELMFHCGVTVYMNYGPDESGTMTELMPDALTRYFRYHPAVAYMQRKKMTDSEWDALIRDNLDLHRPIVYSGQGDGGGHAWICDGYQDSCFYHFNWGWGGSSDGYFYHNYLGFNDEQGAVVNIMPYNSPYCLGGKVMTDYARSFEDGSIYSYYWNNTNCDWLIAPDSVERIKLNFSSLNTQANTDFVSVYDGTDANAPLIGKYSGNQLPSEITSTGGRLYLTFTSNESGQAQGFEASYDARFCMGGGVFTNSSGSFSDGSENYNYLNNSQCNWLISPLNTQTKIVLRFTSFSTEDSADFVYVYDGIDAGAPLLGKFSGNQLPDSVVSSAEFMYIVFITNASTRLSGWDANYITRIVNVAEIKFENSLSIYPNPVNDNLFISLNDIGNWNGNVEIYNVTGKLVYSNKLNVNSEKTSSINISDLPDGFYTIKVIGENGTFVSKLIKD